MKVTTIRELRHDTTRVLAKVAAGETIEVRRRNAPVAWLSPPARPSRVARPDFAARLREIYGTKKLRSTGTEVVGTARDDR